MRHAHRIITHNLGTMIESTARTGLRRTAWLGLFAGVSLMALGAAPAAAQGEFAVDVTDPNVQVDWSVLDDGGLGPHMGAPVPAATTATAVPASSSGGYRTPGPKAPVSTLYIQPEGSIALPPQTKELIAEPRPEPAPVQAAEAPATPEPATPEPVDIPEPPSETLASPEPVSTPAPVAEAAPEPAPAPAPAPEAVAEAAPEPAPEPTPEPASQEVAKAEPAPEPAPEVAQPSEPAPTPEESKAAASAPSDMPPPPPQALSSVEPAPQPAEPAAPEAAPEQTPPTPPADLSAEAQSASPPPVPAAPPAAPAPTAPGNKVTVDLPPKLATPGQPGVAALPPATDGIGEQDGVRIVFEADSSKLPADARAALTTLAKRLDSDDTLRLQLLAYAGDADTSASAARRLSLSRALAVRSYLIENGVRSTRIDVRALGNKSTDAVTERVDVNVMER